MKSLKSVLRRALTAVLALMLGLSPICAVAEDEIDSSVTHIAVADVALKVRRSPAKDSGGIGSIRRDEAVYITELGADWSKVLVGKSEGFVQTKYLSNLREYDHSSDQPGEEVAVPAFDITAVEDSNGFKNNFYAHAVSTTAMFEAPDENSRRISSIGIYEQVIVAENSAGWSYCRYGNSYGYIRTDTLFKWDRINAYAGGIPGLIVYPLMISVNKSTNLYSEKNGKVLKTINPGSMICAERPDSSGRYRVLHHRDQAYVNPEDVASVFEVKKWDAAEPGDLISVMTTFYGVGVSTLNFQGRNWNIYLASSMISGTVLEPGEEFDMNKCIGPYSRSTGYKSAPIMSPKKLTGYGGGTCQVNTTFYITTVAVPLLVTHRKVHANVGMEYCMQGFDAAVGSGDINLQMINTLPYAVRYQFFVSDGAMTCCIYRER